MPVDASIPLSGIAPKLPSAGDLVSLQSTMESMRERKIVSDQRMAALASDKVKEILGIGANAYYTTDGDEETKNRAKQTAIIDQVGELRKSGLYRSLGFDEQKLDEMVRHSNIEVAKIHSLITPPEKIEEEAQQKQVTSVMQDARKKVRLSEVGEMSPEEQARITVADQYPPETPPSLRAQASALLAIPNNPVARKQAEKLQKEAIDLEKENRAERTQKTTPFLTELDRAEQEELKGNTERAKAIRDHMAQQFGVGGITEEQAKLHGQEFLDTLGPQDQVLVKGISDLDLDPNVASKFKGQSARMKAMVLQYKPDWKETDYRESLKAVESFGAGPLGNKTRSFNVGGEHLDTLGDLVYALDNGNMRLMNQAKNAFVTQFGGEAPTNMEGAKLIIADEVVNAIVGSGATGGALADREAAARTFIEKASPKQLLGMIGTYKTLMGGQLHGLEKQYKAATKRNDFRDRYLSDVGKEMAEMSDFNVVHHLKGSESNAAPIPDDVTEEEIDKEIARRKNK